MQNPSEKIYQTSPMEYEEQEESDPVELPHSHSHPPPSPPPQLLNNNNNNNNSGRHRMSTSPVILQLESPTTNKPSYKYRECMKNHAVGLGAHAVDGCCEFMPAGADGSIDALKCAACNCHRNFHRKESTSAEIISFHHAHFPPQHFLQYYRTPPAGYLAAAPSQQRPLALPSTSGGGGSQEQEEEMGMNVSNYTNVGNYNSSGGSGGLMRKRHRTKFTAEQKEKMVGLAERLGWRIQKQDEEAVDKFCEETGIRRHVFKVWMHNNKHTLGKKEIIQ